MQPESIDETTSDETTNAGPSPSERDKQLKFLGWTPSPYGNERVWFDQILVDKDYRTPGQDWYMGLLVRSYLPSRYRASEVRPPRYLAFIWIQGKMHRSSYNESLVLEEYCYPRGAKDFQVDRVFKMELPRYRKHWPREDW